MGHYTNMSAYYDVIMTSGYYDYPKIVSSLIDQQPIHQVLELGCGTGLILEELARRRPDAAITGVDLTPEMLEIAEQRLKPFGNIVLSQQNVCELAVDGMHDLVFSYGGVWYFVVDGDKPPVLVSHIPDDAANRVGLDKLASHIAPGGRLMLGIQGPHHNYAKTIANGMVYSQEIEPLADGFVKHYYLDDGSARVMAQTIRYKTYDFEQACDMLRAVGLQYDPSSDPHTSQSCFIRFTKA